MAFLGNLIHRVPLLSRLVGRLRSRKERHRLRNRSTAEVFEEIHRTNAWGGRDSLSGTGSDAEQTRLVVAALQRIIAERNVATLLDIPCGDFHWMRHADLAGADYTGADIVDELIEENRRRYTRPRTAFRRLDLLSDELPRVDLVFCRDCLVHFSHADVRRALANIIGSGSRFLLTTTFSEQRFNAEIVTGQWRRLNLERPPFSLPSPLELINEGCTEEDGAFADKSLGLWRIEDLRRRSGR